MDRRKERGKKATEKSNRPRNTRIAVYEAHIFYEARVFLDQIGF